MLGDLALHCHYKQFQQRITLEAYGYVDMMIEACHSHHNVHGINGVAAERRDFAAKPYSIETHLKQRLCKVWRLCGLQQLIAAVTEIQFQVQRHWNDIADYTDCCRTCNEHALRLSARMTAKQCRMPVML